ncbi:MAG: hypothetical protein R6W75_04475 [Smithellaceae bacterium]
MKRKFKIILTAAGALITASLLIWSAAGSIEMFLERDAITSAAEGYLEAEAQRDLARIYALLPPSSEYRQTHDYEAFCKDVAAEPPVVLRTYRIIGIEGLRKNEDPAAHPAVEKRVSVEVEVTFEHSGDDTVFNYIFTFQKEKGRWYKG